MTYGRYLGRTVLIAVAIAALAEPVLAHVGGLSGNIDAGTVPTWLTIVTGGVVVGASFLFTSLLTDHDAIRAVNGWGLTIPAPQHLRTAAVRGLQAASVGVLALIGYVGLTGPQTPVANFAILVVWAGWWAGYTMSVYMVGDTWPALNPWRAIATALPRIGDRSYPERFGAWPSVIGLLALVWVEVVSPIASDSRLLVAVIGVYTVVTLGGAAVYGVERWFGTVDPVSRVFRCYGRLAPFQRTADGIAFRLPTTALTEHRPVDAPGHTAFVVGLLWVTTYDGLVATPAWATAIRPIVEAGVPALLVYLVTILAGFGLFYRVYVAASRRVRRTADTYVTAEYIRRWFLPSLLPIAAGYHVAHFLTYFLSLSPALLTTVLNPLDPPVGIQLLVVPEWFGLLRLLFVLLGHFLAVWVAHALAFELFPGIIKPIRSQYPFIVVMVFYTMTSLWVVVQPFTPPPYV